MAQPVQLQHVDNFRDVGYTVNQFLGRKLVRQGVIYRSARPDDATPEDEAVIRDQLGIKTIIDLRTEMELLGQAGRYKLATPNDGPPRPPRVQRVDYREIDLTGRAFKRHLLSYLTWWSFLKVIVFLVLGYRDAASRIVLREAVAAAGPLCCVMDLLDLSGAQVRDVLALYASPQSTPALVHCTHGKDRTGIICILLLMVLDVSALAIKHDHTLGSNAGRLSGPGETLADATIMGFAGFLPAYSEGLVAAMEKHLAGRYGGLDAYLDHIGFGETDRARLREMLLY